MKPYWTRTVCLPGTFPVENNILDGHSYRGVVQTKIQLLRIAYCINYVKTLAKRKTIGVLLTEKLALLVIYLSLFCIILIQSYQLLHTALHIQLLEILLCGWTIVF